MFLLKKNKYTLIILGGICILIILIFIDTIRSKITPKKTDTPVKLSSKSTDVSVNSFQKYEAIPTYPPSRGKGLDLDSKVVHDSQSEIQKLRSDLPYYAIVTNSSGKSASFSISSLDVQFNTWTLSVDTDVDFIGNSQSVYYETNKELFRLGLQKIKGWIMSKGADPEKILLRWSDDKRVYDRIDEWLR